VVLSPDEVAGLGVALNEAEWLGAEIDERRRLAGLTFSTLTLPPSGPPPDDRRVQILLEPVGRVVAVHTSPAGGVVPLRLNDLLPAVQSFGGCPIYGWEFIDVPFAEPSEKSCDVTLGPGGSRHVLHVFQESGDRGALQLWLWFDDLALRTPAGAPIALDEFIAGGRRWWDGFFAGDTRTSGEGMFPLKGDAVEQPDAADERRGKN
jgi:hypothetical protein